MAVVESEPRIHEHTSEFGGLISTTSSLSQPCVPSHVVTGSLLCTRWPPRKTTAKESGKLVEEEERGWVGRAPGGWFLFRHLAVCDFCSL